MTISCWRHHADAPLEPARTYYTYFSMHYNTDLYIGQNSCWRYPVDTPAEPTLQRPRGRRGRDPSHIRQGQQPVRDR